MLDITGDAEVIARLDSIGHKGFNAACEALVDIQLDLVTESRKIVPKMTGYLESNIINLPLYIHALNGGGVIDADVVAQTVYAAYQHERVLDHTKSRRPDAQDHYLSHPLETKYSKYITYLAEKVKRAIQ